MKPPGINGVEPTAGGSREVPPVTRTDEAWLKLLSPETRAALETPERKAALARARSGTNSAADVDCRQASDPSSGGPSSGQLMAAAQAVAAYWMSPPSGALGTLGDTPAPSGASAVTVRLSFVTPEGGHAAVELQHPDLGEVAIEIGLTGRALSVLATATTEHAAAAIRAGQPALAARLTDQGITLHSLDVVVIRRKPATQERKSKRQES